jgi:predicted HicB family RNase H-like nuclease
VLQSCSHLLYDGSKWVAFDGGRFQTSEPSAPIVPITKTPPEDEPEAEPVVVTEEAYRAQMGDEIRREIQAEMAKNLDARPKKKKRKTKESPGGNRHQFSLRLSPDVFQRLQEAAGFESRSITNLVITYLELVYTIPTWELRQILDDYNGRRSRRKQR